jgi:hypothetical membrane protein
VGPYGWIEKIGIFSLGLTLIFVGVEWFLWLGKRLGKLFHVAGVMMALIGLGFVIIGTFNTNTTQFSKTLHGTIHSVTSITVFLLFPIFCILLSHSLRRHLCHKWLALYTLLTGVIELLFLATHVIPVLNVLPSGLFERIVASLDLLWLAIGGSQVTFIARKEEEKLKETGAKEEKPGDKLAAGAV